MEENSLEKNEVKKQSFFSKIMVEVANQCCIIVCALILLLIFDEIIKLFGYYISERVPLFFLLYLIMNICFRPILESSKFKTTVGNKLFK